MQTRAILWAPGGWRYRHVEQYWIVITVIRAQGRHVSITSGKMVFSGVTDAGARWKILDDHPDIYPTRNPIYTALQARLLRSLRHSIPHKFRRGLFSERILIPRYPLRINNPIVLPHFVSTRDPTIPSSNPFPSAIFSLEENLVSDFLVESSSAHLLLSPWPNL